MFDRKYAVRIYIGGQSSPLLEFFVMAQYIKVLGHSIDIDGTVLNFSDNHCIGVEQA